MWGRLAAGWQPARDPEGAPSTAAVRCNRGSWPIDNRPQLTKLPHRSAASLAYHLRSDASPLADESRRRPLLCRTPQAKEALAKFGRVTAPSQGALWARLGKYFPFNVQFPSPAQRAPREQAVS